jgi:hypothetical protein
VPACPGARASPRRARWGSPPARRRAQSCGRRGPCRPPRRRLRPPQGSRCGGRRARPRAGPGWAADPEAPGRAARAVRERGVFSVKAKHFRFSDAPIIVMQRRPIRGTRGGRGEGAALVRGAREAGDRGRRWECWSKRGEGQLRLCLSRTRTRARAHTHLQVGQRSHGSLVVLHLRPLAQRLECHLQVPRAVAAHVQADEAAHAQPGERHRGIDTANTQVSRPSPGAQGSSEHQSTRSTCCGRATRPGSRHDRTTSNPVLLTAQDRALPCTQLVESIAADGIPRAAHRPSVKLRHAFHVATNHMCTESSASAYAGNRHIARRARICAGVAGKGGG